jgi:hypothetical protein
MINLLFSVLIISMGLVDISFANYSTSSIDVDTERYVKRCNEDFNISVSNPLNINVIESEYLKHKNSNSLLDALHDRYEVYKDQHVQVWNSRGTAKKVANKKNPRVIFYKDNLIFAKTDHPSFLQNSNIVEIIQVEIDKPYTFHMIDYNQSPPKLQKNPRLCLDCHGNQPRPIWTSYNYWPGSFRSTYEFQEHNKNPEGMYKKLEGGGGVNSDAFNRYLNHWAFRKMHNDMSKVPIYKSLQLVTLGSILRCDNFDKFFGNKLKLWKNLNLLNQMSLAKHTAHVTEVVHKEEKTRIEFGKEINDPGDFHFNDRYDINTMAQLSFLYEPLGLDMKMYSYSFHPGPNNYGFGFAGLGAGAGGIVNMHCQIVPDVLAQLNQGQIKSDTLSVSLTGLEYLASHINPAVCAELAESSAKLFNNLDEKEIIKSVKPRETNNPNQQKDYTIRGVFNRCLNCHNNETRESGFAMDTREDFFKGGQISQETKKAIINFSAPKQSLLYKFIAAHKDEPRKNIYKMPPTGERLSASDLEHVLEWINVGAPW